MTQPQNLAHAQIVAMGFVWERGSYLRDGWNMLDFLVVRVKANSSWKGALFCKDDV